MNKLEEIINKIDFKIRNLESMDNEYKPRERKILEEICKNNSFLTINTSMNFKISELLLCAVIVGEKYDDLDDMIETINNIQPEIDNMSSDLLMKIISCYFYSKKEISSDKILKKIYKRLKINFYEDFEKITNCANEKILEVLPMIKIIEEEKNEILELNDILLNRLDVDRSFKDHINSTYNMSLIKEDLIEINKYFVLIESENNKRRKEKIKKINKYNSLKNILELTKNVKEITNVDEIVKLIEDEALIEEVLRYITDKNKEYYKELEREYIIIKQNSVVNYIKIFADKNINFNSYTIEEQKLLLKVSIETIERIFEFLEKIGFEIKKDVIKIILGTNIDIISNVDNYIKNGFLTNNFVKNNINIILSNSLTSECALYEILINNINILLKYGINIIGLEEDSLKIFISNSDKIIENLGIIDSHKINIKTRNLKNYNFLLDNDLEEKIEGFNELGMRIEDNLSLLNSDINLIKRIKICKCINLDIYENSQIRKEILDGNLFFIPDSKLDEYIDSGILSLSLS